MTGDVIAQIAQDGAKVLVGAMATDAWAQIRSRVAKVLGRGNPVEEQAESTELEEFRSAVESAPTESRAEVAHEQQAELRGLLRARLRSDPALAAEIAVLVREIDAWLGEQPASTEVRQNARADRGSTVIQAGRDVHDLSFRDR